MSRSSSCSSCKPPRSGVIERLFGAYHFIRARRAGEIYVLEGGLEGWRRLGYQLER